jgi:hypothetical protein
MRDTRGRPSPDPSSVTGIADPSTWATSELRVQGLLHLIRRTHIEHDARIAMSNAIHMAEVVVIGRGDYELAGRISQRLIVCGGTLAAVIGPDTRFAVKAPRATAVEIDLAGSRGVAVVDEGEFDRMIEVYAVHTGRQQMRVAARRALDANRVTSSVRSTAPAPLGSKPPERRMATSREDQRRRPTAETQAPMTEDEQDLERHARNVRGLNASTPFRHQRQPLVQPG